MDRPLASFRTFFRLPDLRKKFFIVLGLIMVSRIIAAVPLPGVDRGQLAGFLQANSAFSLLSIFTGGSVTNFSIAMLGVGPYITASIIFQLMTLVIPRLEALSKEGEFGRKKITQYTRLATIPLALIQGFGTLTFLKNSGVLGAFTPLNVAFLLTIATAGTLLLMWIGELISEQGLGNGLSILITAGIVASFPAQLTSAVQRYSGATPQEYLQLAGFILIAAFALIFIIFINEGQRNVPVTYATRSRAGVAASPVSSTLPLKVNATGVVPIIFAVSMVLFPTIIARFLEQSADVRVKSIGTHVTAFFNNQLYYAATYFILVVLFTYFYTFIVFQPKQMAENLQKQRGYVPGVRPGEDTEKYLTVIIQRLTLIGALFLGLIAILPTLVQRATGVSTLTIGGTSLLIAVAVVLEIIRQVKSQVQTRTYDAYL